jgi:hypothetical protein
MTFADLSPSEYNPYFITYLSKVGEISLMQGLETGMLVTKAFFETLPEDKLEYRYAADKWTPKEILSHLIDSERMFCYRALCIARSENTNLPGFDENEFASNSRANERDMMNLVEEYVAVRLASIHFFKNLSAEVLARQGIANNHSMSVRAAGFIICGHEKHHREVITERYLSL